MCQGALLHAEKVWALLTVRMRTGPLFPQTPHGTGRPPTKFPTKISCAVTERILVKLRWLSSQKYPNLQSGESTAPSLLPDVDADLMRSVLVGKIEQFLPCGSYSFLLLAAILSRDVTEAKLSRSGANVMIASIRLQRGYELVK
ncbi:hypothetical protein Bbelb_092090 [Branchiostoma belcheri]|nr:hypothetical protein Bbelb_092090 [Branchiostoma belcheri]